MDCQLETLLPIIADDKQAFEKFYLLTHKQINAYALAFVGAFLCEDVKHDVYLKLLSGAAKTFKGGNITGWLYTITKNTALNILNKRRFEQATDPPFQVKTPPHDNLFVDEALSKLKPSLRQVVVLRLILDLPFAEIAQTLKISVSAVKWRYGTAIERLKKIYNNNLE